MTPSSDRLEALASLQARANDARSSNIWPAPARDEHDRSQRDRVPSFERVFSVREDEGRPTAGVADVESGRTRRSADVLQGDGVDGEAFEVLHRPERIGFEMIAQLLEPGFGDSELFCFAIRFDRRGVRLAKELDETQADDGRKQHCEDADTVSASLHILTTGSPRQACCSTGARVVSCGRSSVAARFAGRGRWS